MGLITELRPELDPRVLADCVVKDPREVAWTLRQIEDNGGRIALFDLNEPKRRYAARLLTVTHDQLELAGSGEPLNGSGIPTSTRLLVVGYLREIKVQFEVAGFTRAGTRNDPSLRCRLPAALYRIQRRSSHRVRIPGEAAMRVKFAVEVPHPNEPDKCLTIERIFPVVDLSTDGCGFQWPPGSPVPEVGARFGAAWLESKEWEPIPCWLEVVRITGDEKAGNRVVGCQLGVAPESATTLARTLINLQRR